MSAVKKDGVDQFRVAFAELAKVRRGEHVQVDPFLIAQAIGVVMRECTVRTAAGKPVVWNDYRLIMARSDYEHIRPLEAILERDLRTVLAQEAAARKAELVGELRITVVPDEANELASGAAVVRVAFVPNDKRTAPRSGEMTMRLDAWAAAGEIVAKAPKPGSDTVFVDDSATGERCGVYWAGGRASLPLHATFIVGRPHPDAPAQFIALDGAGTTVNKQHCFVVATASSVRVGRFPKANPVHVNGTAVNAGEEVEVGLPAEISLSRGDFAFTIQRA